MDTSLFFIKYIKSIGTPKRAFNNRKQLSWPQIIAVFILLTLLMILPVYRHYSTIEVFSIQDFYPNAIQLINDETVDELRRAAFTNDNLFLEGENYSVESANGMVEIGKESSQFPLIEDEENALLFGTESILISDENGSTEIMPYSSNHSLNLVGNPKELIDKLSQIYTIQNGSSIARTFTFVIYLFIVLALLFMVFVYAYLVYIMKDFTLSINMNYKESVNLILNRMGLPTILALIYGFVRFNVVTMLAIQIICLIVILFVSFRQLKIQKQSVEK